MVVIESDAARKILFRPPTYHGRESSRLFQAIHELARELLTEGYPVILDATNLTEHFRRFLYRIADETGARLILAQLTTPPELIKMRLEARRRITAPMPTGRSMRSFCRLLIE